MSTDDDGSEPVAFENAWCEYATERAILVHFKLDGGKEQVLWVPQSVVHSDSEVYRAGDRGKLIIKQWWAEANGLA